MHVSSNQISTISHPSPVAAEAPWVGAAPRPLQHAAGAGEAGGEARRAGQGERVRGLRQVEVDVVILNLVSARHVGDGW